MLHDDVTFNTEIRYFGVTKKSFIAIYHRRRISQLSDRFKRVGFEMPF